MRYFALVLTVLAAAPLAAQGPPPVGLRAIGASHADARSTPLLTAAVPETNWQKGMIIGGLVGLTLAVMAQAFFGGDSDCSCSVPLTGYILSISVSALVGGLIGSMSSKR